MKTLLTTLLCLLLCSGAFADQRTTVLQEQTTLGKATATLPFIDGSNDAAYEKQANSLIRETATKLAKEVGNGAVISYEVKLNRPSLVSLLLTATNGVKTAYQGLNIDLTTGAEFTVLDFFVDKDEVRENLKANKGEYDNVLFAEQGFLLRADKHGAYSEFVPYTKVLSHMRIGEAGRLMQIAKLTSAAAGKTLIMDEPGLIAIKLDSNPSTGYGWQLATTSSAVAKVGSSFTIPRQEVERVGVPGTEITFLNIAQPGTYTIKMDYKRPWEKLTLDSVSFTVVVK